MLRRAITGHKGLLVLAVFLSVLMASASEIKIQVNPPEPRENQTVILNVTGVTERILFSEWYQGKEINADNQIIRYNTGGAINQGKKYFTRAEIYSNGSLEIKNVTKDLEGDYTVYIQGVTKLYQQTVELKLTEQYTNRTLDLVTHSTPDLVTHSTRDPPETPDEPTIVSGKNGDEDSHLGGGAIAGIVIGVISVLVAVGGVLVYMSKNKDSGPL